MRKQLRIFLAGGVAIASLVQAAAAFAQDGGQIGQSSADDARGVGDIVVTAQRREQNLQDTPIAISAFSEEMLEARGVTDVINIAASTPGLYISQGTASPSTLQIAMRGALEQNGGTITSESPVAIYIDDVYQSRLSAANYDLADIERVEVLRGPQGTLYGRNSMTGAIKLITRQPNGNHWLNMDVSYARFQEVRAKVSGGAPLTGNLALAASAFYDNRDEGWQYNETLDKDVSKFRRYGAQLALGLTNIDGLEAVVTGRYIKSDSDGQHFLPIDITSPTFEPALPFYHTRTPREANGDNEQYSVSLKLGYEIGNLTLRSITAYQHMEENWALDFAGGYVFPNGAIDVGFFRNSDGEQRQFTQEFQLLGKLLDNRLNFILGAFFFDEKASQATRGDLLPPFGASFLPASLDTRSKSTAFYGQVDYEIVPRLTASVGLRYTHDTKSFEGTTQNFFLPELVDVASSIKANVWTPKFNLQWEFGDGGMVYATVAKGYRAAGFNSLVIADPVNYGAPYRPEFAWSYEVGLKLDAFDRLLRMNVAAYHQELSDLQTLADAGGGSFIIQNAAKAQVRGVELEATLNPVRGVSLFGNLTYTDDKYKELDPSTQAAIAGADRLPLISRWQYQVGGTIDIPLGEGALVLAADYNHRSPYFSLVNLAPSSRQKSIGRANGSITYKAPGDKFEVYAQATNLFDSKDWFASAEFIPGVFGYKIPLEPLVWRVGFRYKM